MKQLKQILAIIILLVIPITTFSQVIKYADSFNGANDLTSLSARGYQYYYRSEGPQGTTAIWFQGSANLFGSFNGPADGYVAANYNVVVDDNDIDNWLVLPAINIVAGDSISFYSQSPLPSGGVLFPDSIRVMYSTGDTLPEATTWIELGRFEVNSLGIWEKQAFEIPNSSSIGRLAIRYCVVNGGPFGSNSNFIGIDQLEVIAGDKNRISGNLFLDANNNGIKDSGETAVVGQKIIEATTGRMAFSKPNGDYDLHVFSSGTYTVSAASNYFTTAPLSHTATFSGINQVDSLNDFAFQSTGVFNDLGVTINPLSAARPGFNLTYAINVINYGTTALNGVLILRPYSNLIYNSSTLLPQIISNDSIVWNLGTLNPLQSTTIHVTFKIPSNTTNGTLINSTVEISPVIGDANGYNNFDSWSIPVTGSYDPNEVLVNRSTILTTELPAAPFLDYIINFQNTGNDTAFNIRVTNLISTMLDMNSFELIASTSPVELTFNNQTRVMTYNLNTILLPDSNINEPLSHGYIRYRIKPFTSLQAGSIIENSAGIYFDFNLPVLTNIATTQIVLPSAVNELSKKSTFDIYPNPAKNNFTIALPNSYKEVTVTITNTTGKVMYKTTATTIQKMEVNNKSFSEGIYFVQIQTSDFVATKKLVVSK